MHDILSYLHSDYIIEPTKIESILNNIYAIKAIYGLGDYHVRILTQNGWQRIREEDLDNICKKILIPSGFNIPSSPKLIDDFSKLPDDWLHITDHYQCKIITRKKYFSHIDIRIEEDYNLPDNHNVEYATYSGIGSNLDVNLEKFAKKSTNLLKLYENWILTDHFKGKSEESINLHTETLKTYLNLKRINFKYLIEHIYQIISEAETNKNVKGIINLLKTIQLFTRKQKTEIDDIINYKLPPIKLTKVIKHPHDDVFSFYTKQDYKKYLKKQGFKEFTDDGAPSTISQYLRAIEKIIDLKNYINGWTDVAKNIDTLIVEFDDGGTFADFGTSSHRTPINALCRFKDFLSTISHK